MRRGITVLHNQLALAKYGRRLRYLYRVSPEKKDHGNREALKTKVYILKMFQIMRKLNAVLLNTCRKVSMVQVVFIACMSSSGYGELLRRKPNF